MTPRRFLDLARPLSLLSCLTLSALAVDDWPQWRGPQRTGHAGAETVVPTALPGELKPVWKLAVGGGFSSPVVARGKLIYLDDRDGQETVHVLEAATGKELWSRVYAESFGDEWGRGPRSTPIIDQDRLYVQACNGQFRCLRWSDGETVWQTSYDQFGVKFLGSKAREGTASRRGNNGCGVIDGERLVLPVGSTNGASLVCFDKRTGRELWRCGNDEAAYSSFMVATLAGVRQVVAFTADALLGAEVETGRLLWRVPLKTNAKRHAATPVIRGDTVTVNSHTFGMICFGITREAGDFQARPLWTNKDLRINLATPVLIDGHLFTFGADRSYACIEASSGQVRWTRSGFGRGPRDNASSLALGNRVLVLTEAGLLTLIEADPSKYRELGRLQVCGDTWSHPAYAEGKLYVRDRRELICLQLGPPSSPSEARLSPGGSTP